MQSAQRARAGRRREGVRGGPVVAPLVGVQVPVRRPGHLPRGADPVGAGRQLLPAGVGADLLLPHVVRPAAAVDALAAGEQQQREEGAVDGVGVEPVVGPGPHHDHAAAPGLLRGAGELPGGAHHRARGHRGDGFLPGGGAGRRSVLVRDGPLSVERLARHAVLGEEQVEHRGHQAAADAGRRHRTAHGPALSSRSARSVEAGQGHRRGPGVRVPQQAQEGVEVTEVEVPAARAALVPAVAEGAVGHHGRARRRVDEHRHPAPRVRLCLPRQVRVDGGDEGARSVRSPLPLVEGDEERQVGEAFDVVGEVRDPPVDEALAQDHVAHRHGERAVGPGVRVQPLVGELRRVGVVRRHDDDLLAAVAGLGHPVGVRGAGHRHVGTPQHQVRGVPPVP